MPALGEMGLRIERSFAFGELSLNFLKIASDRYKNNASYFLIKHYNPSDIDDCSRMYFKLAAETQELLWTEKPSIAQIHDWLVEKWDATEK